MKPFDDEINHGVSADYPLKVEQVKLLVWYTADKLLNATYVEWEWEFKTMLGCWGDGCSVRVQPSFMPDSLAWFYKDQVYDRVAAITYNWETLSRVSNQEGLYRGADSNFSSKLASTMDVAMAPNGWEYLQREYDKYITLKQA